jgi:hypothetical protein
VDGVGVAVGGDIRALPGLLRERHMSNDHVPEPFRSLLNDLTRSHRAAREELREGMAALNRVNGVKPMPQPGWDVPPDYYAPDEEPEHMKIIIERSPYPNAEPQYRWTAYWEGLEDELSKSGMTPDEALSRFLIAASNRDEQEID